MHVCVVVLEIAYRVPLTPRQQLSDAYSLVATADGPQRVKYPSLLY